jgi:hypothetical protein
MPRLGPAGLTGAEVLSPIPSCGEALRVLAYRRADCPDLVHCSRRGEPPALTSLTTAKEETRGCGSPRERRSPPISTAALESSITDRNSGARILMDDVAQLGPELGEDDRPSRTRGTAGLLGEALAPALRRRDALHAHPRLDAGQQPLPVLSAMATIGFES